MRPAPWMLVIACVMTASAVARLLAVESPATVRQVHETRIKPASDVIFNVGRGAPSSDEQWIAIAAAGATLVKSGTLLIAASPPQGRAKWATLSRQLSTAGRTARRAAEARNLGALIRASDHLVIVCESCHAPYRKQILQP